MSMTCSPTEAHKAAKRHRCDWCWQFVEPGDQYKRYRVWSSGEAATIRMHPECHGAMEGEALDEGGFIEWTPGQQRPTHLKG